MKETFKHDIRLYQVFKRSGSCLKNNSMRDGRSNLVLINFDRSGLDIAKSI